MRAPVWTVPGLVWMALACGGGVPPAATAPDEVPEKRRGARERPTDAPEPPRSGVDSVSGSGCEAVERGLVRLFTAAPTRANDGEVCTVTSRGEARRPRALTSLLIRALKGWDDAGRLAADGDDATQFARRRGGSLCVVLMQWDLSDGSETGHRITVTCGPEDHWPDG